MKLKVCVVCSRDWGKMQEDVGYPGRGERVCPGDTSHEGLALGGNTARAPEHPPALA